MNHEPIDKEALAEQLVSSLKQVNDLRPSGNAAWAAEIKKQLYVLAAAYGCDAYGDKAADNTAVLWLNDMSWFRQKVAGDLQYIKEFTLAVQCLWGRNLSQIKHDFDKLLVCNAQVRLMICDSTQANLASRLDYFRASINAYSSLGEGFFLIANWNSDTGLFEFRKIEKSAGFVRIEEIPVKVNYD